MTRFGKNQMIFLFKVLKVGVSMCFWENVEDLYFIYGYIPPKGVG